jgi:hypothetical protein
VVDSPRSLRGEWNLAIFLKESAHGTILGARPRTGDVGGGNRAGGRPRDPFPAERRPVAPARRDRGRPPPVQGGRCPPLLHRQREVGTLLGGLLFLRAVQPFGRRDREIPPPVRGGDLPGSGGGEGARGTGVLHRRLRSGDAEPGGVDARGGRGGADPDRAGAGNVREPGDPPPVRRGVPPLAGTAFGSPQPGDVPLLLPEGVHHPRLRGGRGGGARREGGGSVGVLRRHLRAG